MHLEQCLWIGCSVYIVKWVNERMQCDWLDDNLKYGSCCCHTTHREPELWSENLTLFPQGDPGGITGPPGLPGPKGEVGPPGKSLPGEPVSSNPFTNISFESWLIAVCVLPVSDHKYRNKFRSAEKKKHSSYSLDQSSNPFGNLIQTKVFLLKTMHIHAPFYIQFWKIYSPSPPPESSLGI